MASSSSPSTVKIVKELDGLGLKEETKQRLLRDNAAVLLVLQAWSGAVDILTASAPQPAVGPIKADGRDEER
jgi:hypothetical protein